GVAQVLLSRENISQADAHDGSAAQSCPCKISAPGSIDALHDVAVELVRFFFGCPRESKTNNRHHYRRRQFKAIVGPDPVGQKICQTQVLANARRDSSAAKRAKNHPCFQCPESSAQLDAVVHVVFLRLHCVAAQIFRNKCEDPAQPLEIAHVEHTEIQ